MIKNNPLVSIIAVSYNQERFIKESLNSLLAQDYSPLQIIISDDNSSDATYEIISKMAEDYKGPHQLIINRNNSNLGIGENRNKAIQLSTGDLLATADGDDISAPTRITELVNCWNQITPPPLLITTDAIDTLESGEILNIKHCDDFEKILSPEEFLIKRPLFWGCTNIYTRELITKFGGLNDGVGADDQIMILRALLLGNVYSFHKALVYHRQDGIGSTKAISAKEKGLLLIKKAPIALADINQMMQDSSRVDLGQKINNVLKKSRDEANFTIELHKSKTFFEKLQQFKKYPNAPFFKKLRIFSYICTPFIFQVFFRL